MARARRRRVEDCLARVRQPRLLHSVDSVAHRAHQVRLVPLQRLVVGCLARLLPPLLREEACLARRPPRAAACLELLLPPLAVGCLELLLPLPVVVCLALPDRRVVVCSARPRRALVEVCSAHLRRRLNRQAACLAPLHPPVVVCSADQYRERRLPLVCSAVHRRLAGRYLRSNPTPEHLRFLGRSRQQR